MGSASISTPIDFEGNKTWTILKLATPTVFAMLLQSIVNDIDVVFFSHLPDKTMASNAQAALLPSLIIVWLFGGSLGAISVGTQALTARRFAEHKHEDAGAVLANGMWFTLVGGVLFTVLGYFSIPVILHFMIPVHAVRVIGIAYSRWRLLGFVSMSMTMAVKGFFDGTGKTTYHFVASFVMNAVNVLLCWTFIFGHFGAPALGAPGAGLSAFLATWVGLAIMLVYVFWHRKEFHPLRWSNLSRRLTWDMFKLSMPAALATIVMMAGFGLFSRIVGRLDRHHVEAVNAAATTDIIEILKLTFTACIAFGTATATLVSQSLGRNKPDEASRYGWTSVRLGLLVFGVVGLLEGLVFRAPLIDFLTQSVRVREAMMVPMLLMAIVTPLISVALILSEALFGAGSPKFVAAAQLVLVFGLLVPGAYLLGLKLGYGLLGIWMTACAYAVLAAVTMSIKFWRGAWKTIRL